MNKITKLLSVFIIAGAIGTGVAGVAGCNNGGKGGNGGGGETTCSHTYNNPGAYEDNGNGTHNKTCDKCEVTVENEACTDANSDGFCDKCEGELGGGETTVGITITTTATTIMAVEGTKIELTATVTNSEEAVTWTVEGTDAAHAEIVTEGGKTYLQVKATATAGMTFTVKASIDGATPKTKTISVKAAPKYYELANSENCILDSAELFATDGALATTEGGTKGVYAYDSSSVANIAGGKASAYGGIYVDFGTTKDVIEGNLVINVTKEGSSGHTLFRLATNGSGHNEIFGIKTGGQYRFNGDDSGKVNFTGNNYVQGTPYEITFKYNKVTNKLTVTLGDTQSIVVYDGTAEFTDALAGFTIHTKNAADTDNIDLTQFAVVTYDIEGADYVDAIKDAVNGLDAEAVALKGTGEWTASATATTLSEAKSAALEALVATATKEEADGALATYKTALFGALSAEYMAKLEADYPVADYNTSGGEGEPTAYDTAMATAQEALEAVTKIKDYAGVYAAQKTALADVPTAAEEVTAKVTITLYLADGTTVVGTLTEQLDGSKLTIANFKVAAATYLKTNNKKLVAVYKTNTEGALSEKIEGEYTVTAKTDGEGNKVDTDDVKLYVELGEWTTAGLDFAAIKTEYDKTADEEGNGGSAISKDDKGNFKIQDVYAKADESVSGLVKCEAFEFTNSVKSVGIGTAAMSPDGTAANQTYTYLTPSGNTDASNAYTIVAKKDIVLTITYNTGDSSNVGGKKGKLMYKIGTGDAVTVDVETSSKTQVYTAEIELKAGETLTFYSSASRLIIFGLDAKY